MSFVYRFTIGLLFFLCLPVLLLWVVITGKHRDGLSERFGSYPDWLRQKTDPTYWLHASSVGEVQAVKAVLHELRQRDPNGRIVVTTMTAHGKRIAQKQLPEDVSCFLAPLDIPFLAGRAVKKINPDVYICFETELWPVLIHALTQKMVRVCMVNGRISDRSYATYLKFKALFCTTLRQFDKMAVISETDREKFISLGVDQRDISAFGNVKYDLPLPIDEKRVAQCYRNILRSRNEEVFVAGSTHSGEERELLTFYDDYLKANGMLFLLAPRHVDRIPEIEKRLQKGRVEYQLFSQLSKEQELRTQQLVLIDTMGDLAKLYSAADFVFCGGSLVDKGGHNLMEPALWQKVVFYGPSIGDFRDAAALLESAQAGIQVKNIGELKERIEFFRMNPSDYTAACHRAGKIARSMQGCSHRQVDFILPQF